jgi:hypothetical protein
LTGRIEIGECAVPVEELRVVQQDGTWKIVHAGLDSASFETRTEAICHAYRMAVMLQGKAAVIVGKAPPPAQMR